MKRRNFISILTLSTLLPATGAANSSDNSAAAMAEAANAVLKSLSEDQAKKAIFAFESEERENWHFVPKRRKGLSLKEMTPAQRELNRKLIGAGMSETGAKKVDVIIELEDVLGDIENRREYRDPELYFTSIFGEPSATGTWGWRFEGHHIAVNITLSGGRVVSTTPSFLGANRAETREGRLKGERPLGQEEDLARKLAVSLKDSGKPVVFSEDCPREIFTVADRVVRQLDVLGVPSADLTAGQREDLLAVVSEYANLYDSATAARNVKRVKEDMENLRFAWAGSLKKGEAYYYRIHGKRVLIEVVNFQNEANHIHTVWRDLEIDFGRGII